MAASTHHQVDEQELETIRRLRFVDTKQSDETLKSTFCYFGYIYLAKIINNSDKVVHFQNPYLDRSGDIQPGETEDAYSKGYLPYWSYIHRYEITYYNKVLKKEKKILIKDLEEGLLSFFQEGNGEDIRDFSPYPPYSDSQIQITIQNDGYQIYILDGAATKRAGGVLFSPAN
ncbi:hypothetical protein O6P43_014633 [Quillaja saponaria]|uniref:Uncharacterized protein n=1 Tax=Quillaja saponaria TaxID=32244 RepID=A0AAD7LV56_QUISA|nr:hypothetical protein O6P43_014633 [Quillaja saponaria]